MYPHCLTLDGGSVTLIHSLISPLTYHALLVLPHNTKQFLYECSFVQRVIVVQKHERSFHKHGFIQKGLSALFNSFIPTVHLKGVVYYFPPVHANNCQTV